MKRAPVPAPVFARRVASRTEAVDAVCRELRAFLQAHGLAADGFALELLGREALNNAVLHGHAGHPEKLARIEFRVGRLWLHLRITDEGPGFDWRTARRRVAQPDGTSGRGLTIGALYADHVHHNRAGNEITFHLARSTSAKRHSHGHPHP